MNYIGSKKRLLAFIEEKINEIVDKPVSIFCDLFAGTGVVGAFFKEKGYSLIANDLQYYSYVLNKSTLGINTEPKFESLTFIENSKNSKSPAENVCAYLTSLEGRKGFIYKNYAAGGTKSKEFKRTYFYDENAKKCDDIREKIEEWNSKNLLTDEEYFYLLACLIQSIDLYANTASIYGAYLKKLKKTALATLVIKPIKIIPSTKKHAIYNMDSNKLAKKIKADIFYLDPPYNHRQYGANYHILETIACMDSPKIRGKTGQREQSDKRSSYCLKREVKKAFSELMESLDGKYIFLSYNNEGLLSLDEVKDIMSQRGEYGVFKKKYQRFKADKDDKRVYKAKNTEEYLHYVKVRT